MTALASKQRRLRRNYQRREQWFLLQAKARLAANRRPPRVPRSGLAVHLDSMNTLRQFIEKQQQ